MKNDLETEVKFHIAEPLALRNRILSENAPSGGRIFEKNIIFDTEDLRLRKQGILLRLRLSDICLLTLKTKAEEDNPEFKILREIETELKDCKNAEKILAALGFKKTQIYEKYRESFKLHRVEICLDEMPFGFFTELEGEQEDIRKVARLLGLDWSKKLTLSYRAIFESLAKHHNYKFKDISFKEFSKVKADLKAILKEKI